MNKAISTPNLSDRTELAIREVVGGRRGGLGAALLFAGPAVIASIAYMDPGNFATNRRARVTAIRCCGSRCWRT
jgi:manganese transport protein